MPTKMVNVTNNITTVAFTSNLSNIPDVSIFDVSDFVDTTSPSVLVSSAGTTDSPATDTVCPDLYDYYGNGSSYMDYEYDYGDEYMYPGFSFERPVYLYIWEILVLFTSLVNIVVVSILLRRKMRNSTNMILAAIAICDSLTGLVTLPTYIMAFQKFDPAAKFDYSGFPANHTIYPSSAPPLNHPSSYPPGCNNQNPIKGPYDGHTSPGSMDTLLQDVQPSSYAMDGFPSDYPVSGDSYDDNSDNETDFNNGILSSHMSPMPQPAMQEVLDGYVLNKPLCRGFMISKYFLSKTFHTMSIFLTLFLAIQRFISVAYPFKSQNIFSVRNTCICFLIIVLISPIFHTFHLDNEKALSGLCQWELSVSGCKGGCIYLWLMFFLRHFVPCVALITFTALFISELNKGERKIRRMDSASSQVSRRAEENRRITIVVISIVIVFLIPEVPYGAFLLYNAIEKTANNGKSMNLETNRAVHMVYELLLVLSFHANFYIYTLFNRRFRKMLKRPFICSVRRFFGGRRRFSVSTSSFSRPVTRKTDFSLSKSGNELQTLNTNASVFKLSTESSRSCVNSDQNAALETKFIDSISGEIIQNQETSEMDSLNANV